ncbi:Deoxyuridine 5'-triphosphate nucleotidohydrolase [Sphingobium yanoikuyae]|uniref:dUTP diphosphatase n=2 Tax=Sphingobium yanoikuyae TaxID=13690 RepID=A0A084EU41_SPHYA|nr:Deoxyuridine 5'-triphosphate nucleotidohydrolase [Sphingobium yanoikuyae]
MGVGLTNNRRESGVRFTQRKWVNLQTPLFHIGFTQTGDLKPDYRGELKVLLINHGADPFPIKRGDRIAQLIVAPVQLASFVEVDMLDDTVRGMGGFGSTGV